ncbi:amidohydrolase [Ktedonosporobacter rubrisoli]|uniref:amidohydrolase n=1 Tax=Ktedonosporobacter rubrisoli TaxID=2509675 RepID=UPI001A938172|nr:amidohydrolase [Ktedonosporobacter rubrisoli]
MYSSYYHYRDKGGYLVSAYWLTDVRLETGRVSEDGWERTQTALFHLKIADGQIEAILAAGQETPQDGLELRSAQQALALPAFIEKHVHLDKTFLGGGWRPTRPVGSILERVALEVELLKQHPLPTEERASKFLDVILAAGSTHVRTHIDIAPAYGLSHLEAVQGVLQAYHEKLSYEIVAFPQHGLLRTRSQKLVREAMRQGATLVGGVDPATVDNDIERSLGEMMEIAVEFKAGIDLHLHDQGPAGLATIQHLADLTAEAGWQGRVAISHAFALADLDRGELENLALRLAELQIAIVSSVPYRVRPPLPRLRAQNVPVALGCDNVYDSWSSFGNGDILERLNRLAQLEGWGDEASLSRSLGLITGGKTPLNDAGEQVWPQVGDSADLVLLDASCSAEAIARRAKRLTVLHRGRLIAGTLNT